MIVPLFTTTDPDRGNVWILVYLSDGERRQMMLSPEQHVQWKRWIFQKKHLLRNEHTFA